MRRISLPDPTSRWPSRTRHEGGAARDGLGPSADLVLGEVARACQQFGLDALRPQINACEAMLHEADVLDVAVVGRFKAGKSSFLNAIIGRHLLPVAVLPVTAIVTRVAYGPHDRLAVQFSDGTRRETGPDQLAEFVAEQRNPGNRKGVAMVDVEVRDLESYRGVRFVDTPGLGSAYAHNTRTSMEWLPRVGAALLTVSVEHPLSEDDIALLKELRQHTPEISILLTKADLVSPGELADVTRFVQQQLAALDGDPIRILPFSDRPGFEGVRRQVHDYLLQHVVSAHAEKSGDILRHKLRSLIAGCRQYLDLALCAAGAAEHARDRLRRQLDEEREVLSAVRKEIWLLAADLKVRLRDGYQEALLARAPQLLDDLSAELRREMPQWTGNLKRTTAAFVGWARQALHEQLERLSAEVGGPFSRQQLTGARGRFERVVRGFQDRLAQGIQDALGVRFEGARFEAEIDEPNSYWPRPVGVFCYGSAGKGREGDGGLAGMGA